MEAQGRSVDLSETVAVMERNDEKGEIRSAFDFFRAAESRREAGEMIDVLEANPVTGDSDVTLFEFERMVVRVVFINGNPWWVAKDVCDVLGLSDVSKSCSKLDEDEKLIRKLFVSGQNRDTLLISESGLYILIMRSNKPGAKRFKRWVTHELLPTIRKTGSYALPGVDPSKNGRKEELAEKRLAIMERNANCRMAKMILKGMDAFKDVMTKESKTVFMAKYGELVTDVDLTRLLPRSAEPMYSATDIGKECGVSAQVVGKVAKSHHLKSPAGEDGEYGYWIRSKSRYSSKEVNTFVYNERGREWFLDHFGITAMVE
ncbi:Bro-N domain-containing protein [Dethiosulfovibrio peptidovorans]|nr:Bro-N domain-containing protein [Dethiosulfovibrio peptidovorans]